MNMSVPTTPAPDDVEDLTSSVLVRRYGDTVVIGTRDPITLTGHQAVQLYELVAQVGTQGFNTIAQLGVLAVLPPDLVEVARDEGSPVRPLRMSYACGCGWSLTDDTGDAAAYHDEVDEHLELHEREDQT